MKNQPHAFTDLEKIFYVKSAIFCGGMYISPLIFTELSPQDQAQYKGRKGGAGPAGGRYFRFSNNSIVNCPLWLEKSDNTQVSVIEIRNQSVFTIQCGLKGQIITLDIDLIPVPEYYDKKTSNGVPLQKIAVIHGDNTIATTLNQRCHYWRNDEKCQFCGIEFSVNSGATTPVKTGSELVEAITQARSENANFAGHMTMTIGTQDTPGRGIEQYIPVLEEIRTKFPKLPIHIQVEPVEDKNWYNKAYDAGATTIGIHLEILDEIKRELICPGKKHISKQDYFEHWEYNVKLFGKGQVSTFLITGYDQDYPHYKEDLKKMIQIGVLPLITPARQIPGNTNITPKTDFNWYLDILEFAAQNCKKYNLNPTDNKAGCLKCGGCSALNEAYNLLENLH